MWSPTSAKMRYFEHGMLGVLLAAALASSAVGQLLGWPDDASLGLPRGAKLTVLLIGAVAVALLPVRQRGESLVRDTLLRLGAIALAAVPIAWALRRASNTFYTAPSLIDGMVLLLVLHLSSRIMRRVAVAVRETYFVVPVDAPVARRGERLRQLLIPPRRPRSRALTLPAVALADALASVAAWSLLAFWILVALERRHVASAVVMFTCTLLVLECAILIPDTLAAAGYLPRGLHSVDDMRERRVSR